MYSILLFNETYPAGASGSWSFPTHQSYQVKRECVFKSRVDPRYDSQTRQKKRGGLSTPSLSWTTCVPMMGDTLSCSVSLIVAHTHVTNVSIRPFRHVRSCIGALGQECSYPRKYATASRSPSNWDKQGWACSHLLLVLGLFPTPTTIHMPFVYVFNVCIMCNEKSWCSKSVNPFLHTNDARS